MEEINGKLEIKIKTEDWAQKKINDFRNSSNENNVLRLN